MWPSQTLRVIVASPGARDATGESKNGRAQGPAAGAAAPEGAAVRAGDRGGPRRLRARIRTPLTGILALGELLAASDLPERERGWAAAVKGAAEHLAQLTTLVVGGTKAATGAPGLRREPIRPRGLAAAMAATLTARAETKASNTTVPSRRQRHGVAAVENDLALQMARR